MNTLVNISEVVNRLEERGYFVECNDIVKNGVTFKGLTIRTEETETVAPCIYIEPIIEESESLEEVLDRVISLYESHKQPSFDVQSLMKKDFILENIRISLQKTSEENIIKRESPFAKMEQYLTVISDFGDGNGAFKVREEHLERVGIELDEAWASAFANTCKTSEILSLTQALFGYELEEDEVTTRMYVISNKERFKGSGAILDTDKIRQFAKERNIEKAVLCPSSVHEWLMICPTDEMDISLEEYNALVQSVNAEQVEEHEQLGDEAIILNFFDL